MPKRRVTKKKAPPKRKRRRNSKNKGGAFERQLCKQFSLWWSEGKRDDLFWRTSNSGGRATFAKRKNRDIKGQYGDMGAIDPLGHDLVSLLTFEFKRGYNKNTIQDLLDKSSPAKQEYEKWIEQAERSYEQAGSYAWFLVVRRDRRKTIGIVPRYFWKDSQLKLKLKTSLTLNMKGGNKVVAFLMEDFFDTVERKHLISLD